ncbi:MAG: hypothetical protein AAGE43_05860 [Pseudomonadota bacterium]
MNDIGLADRFEQLQISAPDFHHEDHVKVAFDMLDRYDFVDACSRYASTIRAMAQKVGVPEKFNATITFAFMSVIAERKAGMPGADLTSFLAANPDLLDKDVLTAWYSEGRLTSPTARRQFLLPDRVIA